MAKTSWLATPVNFEARLDHVRLTPHGLLALAPEDRAAWCAEFAVAFGPELSLHEAGSQAFLLMGLPALTAQSFDPARYLGGDISQGLPVGPDANRLRRLGTEIEMWAHGCALNREREKRRQPLLSALWLWGGHGFPMADLGNAQPRPSLAFAGEDACLAGLSRLTTGREPVAIPEALEAFAPEAEYRIAELHMNDREHSLAHLDTHWFGPAGQALKEGKLIAIQIFANDRIFYVVNLDRAEILAAPRVLLDRLAATHGADAKGIIRPWNGAHGPGNHTENLRGRDRRREPASGVAPRVRGARRAPEP